ncbi:MAG: hypothetical protein M3R20_03750 [Pseudomonadota bacterium]|nr:hypothetical protein [Pseudomonadota bacterium]
MTNAPRSRVARAARGCAYLLGVLWTSPNTLVGLLAGFVLSLFGARPYFAEGSLAFRRVPRARGALVMGCVILHGGENLEAIVPTYAARCGDAPRGQCVRLGDHERAHVYQYLAFGPLFLPLYFLRGGVSARNPFERAADRYALTGQGWLPFLPL